MIFNQKVKGPYSGVPLAGKILLRMKLMILLTCVMVLQASATSYAQRISLNVRGIPLDEAMRQVQEQSGYRFFVNAKDRTQVKVSALVKDASLETAMDELLKGLPFNWTLKNSIIVISAKEGLRGEEVASGIAQQTVPVSGTVLDERGDPLTGVTVHVKGTSITAITNEHGTYRMNVPRGNQVLVFSMIGFNRQDVTFRGQSPVNIRLHGSTDELDEVVVIGYGTARREDLTGSVGIVKVEELANAPVLSFDQALAGRIAGVQVSASEGQPGGEGINIVIRGAGSLTQSNAPLYVVDGFPIEDFDTGSLNMDDIESINILKDASATAIYGARGANGVIIIETKRGKVGAPVVTYNGSYGFQEIIKRMEMMDAYEFVRYQVDRGSGNRYFRDSTTTLESYRNVQGVDWQDLLFRQGATHIHNIAARGGSEQTKYSVSASVFDADAVIINTGSNRYQGRFSLEQTFSQKVKAGLDANYSSRGAFGREASLANTAGSATSYLLYATLGYRPITGSPDFSLDDLEDAVVDEDVNPLEDYRINPIISTQNEYRKTVRNNLVTNAYVSYEIIKGLTLKVTGGVNTLNSRSENFFNSRTSRGTPLLPSNSRGQWGSKSFSERIALSNENTLTYRKKFNQVHQFDAVGGYSMQESRVESGGFTAVNVPNESLGIHGLRQGTPLGTSGGASMFRLQSYLARANYNYDSRYLFTTSFRSDGSSKFLTANKWGFFPSGAFAWRMINEPFMKKQDVVSDAKLRISYGLTGNNRVSDFAAFALVDPNNNAAYSFGNQVPTQGVNISSLGNANLKWETTEQIDLGYDIAFLKNRLEFTVDVYRKTTNDLLLNANMPYHTGFVRVFKNIGKVQNQGIELTLNTVNVQNRNFSWQSNFNISFNNNKILALAEGENSIINNLTWETAFNNTPAYISKIGQPAGQMYGYLWEGIYQFDDFNENGQLRGDVTTNNNDRQNITVKPGDIKYRDLNGDGVINQYDLTVIGRGIPIHIGGFSNNFTYKGVSLGVFFQWSYGSDILNANRLIFEGSTRLSLNQFASYANRWTPENPSNEHYRVGGWGPNGIYSSKIVEDGSFLRLKTLFLGYSLPKPWIRGAKIQDLTLTASAQNLVTWTSYSGFDPEVSSMHSVLTPGFDYSAYPHARTVVFGIKATL